MSSGKCRQKKKMVSTKLVVVKSRKGMLQKDRIVLHCNNKVAMAYRSRSVKTNISNPGFCFLCFFVDLIIRPCNFHSDDGSKKYVYKGG